LLVRVSKAANDVLRMGLRSIDLNALNCDKKSQLAKKPNAMLVQRVITNLKHKVFIEYGYMWLE